MPKPTYLSLFIRLASSICFLISGTAYAQTAAQTPPSVPAAKFTEIIATPDLIAQLRGGGFVLYLRHGNTDNSRPDRIPSVDLDDCSTQRPLNEAGRVVATTVGESIRSAGIPVSDITLSPLCRVQETASLAFPGATFATDNNLMYTANLTDAQKAPIIANTRRLLAAPVNPGTNRLVIAHAPNIMDLIGYFPKEGTLVIFRPGGPAGFEYVASIPAGAWPALLRREPGK